ncbi:MAG: FAD-binding domain-containing protein, partial [Flavobacteriaceae bacterium]
QPQNPVSNSLIPKVIVEASTGISAIDDGIKTLYRTGYLHNHLRMYVASLACNIGQSAWNLPARWMYYHLLDGDWASNALSWQWVAGSNSHKKYYANQDNINKYCYTQQKDTFLDVAYDEFKELKTPEVLLELDTPSLKTSLPQRSDIVIDPMLPSCIYNWYNLDPLWKGDLQANRILLLEPSHFKAYPISAKSLDFMLSLSQNIQGIQCYVGEFKELVSHYSLEHIHYKEHPLNTHYHGNETPRDWMFEVKGYYPSFFGFWKACRKTLNY